MTTAPSSPGAVPQTETNGLAIAGFVISLVGILFGGILCPIGLIVSIVAMGRQPKGFAIAGIVLGALGTCGGLIAILVFGAAILVALGVVAAVALTHEDATELTFDMIQLSALITEYRAENRYLPASLDDLDADQATLTDPWGNPYEYMLTAGGQGFDLLSLGADGVRDTEDDVALSNLGNAWGYDGTVKISSSSGGNFRVTIGNRSLDVTGSEDGGTVNLDLGDKVLRIEGGDEGGTVEVVPEEAPADEAPPDPAPPSEAP